MIHNFFASNFLLFMIIRLIIPKNTLIYGVFLIKSLRTKFISEIMIINNINQIIVINMLYQLITIKSFLALSESSKCKDIKYNLYIKFPE